LQALFNHGASGDTILNFFEVNKSPKDSASSADDSSSEILPRDYSVRILFTRGAVRLRRRPGLRHQNPYRLGLCRLDGYQGAGEPH